MSNLPPGYSGYDGSSLEAYRCGLCLHRWTETGSYHFNARDTDPQCPRWGRKHAIAERVLRAVLIHKHSRIAETLYDYLTWPHQQDFVYELERAHAIADDVMAEFFNNELEAK